MPGSGLRLLCLDIESAPCAVLTWSLFDQHRIADEMMREPGYTLCIAWRWIGRRGGTKFKVLRRRASKPIDLRALRQIHRLMSVADGIVTFNGDNYDLPILNREFLEAGLKPPAPPQSVDLYKVVRKKFRFASGKMSYVSKRLGVTKKAPSPGIECWIGCMAGEPKAWKKMETYNRRDALVTEALYKRLLPWIDRHPNAGLVAYGGRPKQDDPNRPLCPRCAGVKLNRVGRVRTKTAEYQRYQCYRCGYWSRDRKNILAKDRKARVLA